MTNAGSTFVRDGVRLHVDDSGGTGLPVVFQHGLGGDALQTAEVFPDTPVFRRLTLECRGHGRSEAGDIRAFSLAQFTGDLIALVETLGHGPLVVGGISMGAAIALRLAVLRPDLVRGLILARPAWLTGTAPPNMQPNIEVATLMTALTPGEARTAFLAGETGKRLAHEAPDNLTSLTGFFDRPRTAQTAALLAAIASDGPDVTREQLRTIAVPALVIATNKDAIHPLDFAERLAALIPHARLALITSKADDRSQYVRDFQESLGVFLKDFVR